MFSTRLLVLGAVRIFQPVHGYLVRRELLTWDVEQWAHLNPGSIYHALRTLARDGLLEEVATGAEGGRPARTSYRLTRDGEAEFTELLRRAFWQLDVYRPDTLLAGLCFAFWLRRDEITAALENRVKLLDVAIEAGRFEAASMRDYPEKQHVPELYAVTEARLAGEREWARDLAVRIQAGAYRFVGEPGEVAPGAGAGMLGPAGRRVDDSGHQPD